MLTMISITVLILSLNVAGIHREKIKYIAKETKIIIINNIDSNFSIYIYVEKPTHAITRVDQTSHRVHDEDDSNGVGGGSSSSQT